ncbi:MAG: PAS domain-containing sensor histidine kinase [Verrucomicrobia bacterium]|nr:MAG: PAS domain-containing sensor histidine kinase [Verrucomicrobiota bacterium]
MKNDPLERILGKIDDLDPTNLTILAQRLAHERRLLEAVFNIIQEGILIIDSKGVIEYSNQVANQMINLSDKDLGTAILWKFVPDLARSIDFSNLGRNMAVFSREIHMTYPENRFVRLYMVPLNQNNDDSPPLFVIILRDVTEEKFLTEEMIENEKLSSLFMLTAGVAHELGNPLNSINIHLQIIHRLLSKIKDSPELSKIKDSTETCINEVSRLDSIVQNFLSAIRPVQPELTEMNLLELLNDVLSLQRHEMEDLGIRVEIILSNSLPLVLVDRNQIKQVFFNVIKNAIHAMGKNGLLKISTEADDDYLNMHFDDNGSGIEEKHFSKIFDPYFSTKDSGSGMGMMIIQRIMRNHAGQVAIKSLPGVGTRVTLMFPLQSKRVKMLESS